MSGYLRQRVRPSFCGRLSGFVMKKRDIRTAADLEAYFRSLPEGKKKLVKKVKIGKQMLIWDDEEEETEEDRKERDE